MSKQYVIMNKKTGKFLLDGSFDSYDSRFGSLQHRDLHPMTKTETKMEMKYAFDRGFRYFNNLVVKEIKRVVVK